MRRDRSLTAGDLRGLISPELAGHIDGVYRRLELAAGDEPRLATPLRLVVLVHEEPLGRLPALLERAGLSDAAPLVTAVIGSFGRLWKLQSDEDARDYVATHRAYLEPLLLFELVHEGAPASWMRRIAALGGLEGEFDRWIERLERDAVPPAGLGKP